MFKLGDARKKHTRRACAPLAAVAMVMLAVTTVFAAPTVAQANPLVDVWNGIVSFFAGDAGVEPAAAGEQADKKVDPDTMTSWKSHAEKSTQNIGRIWTDKTVTQSDVSLGHLDGQQTTTVGIGQSDFLVALSALSSASNTATTTNTPLDIVLVLDRSGSMGENMTSYVYNETYNINQNRGTYFIQLDDGSYAEVERVTAGDWWNPTFDHWEVNGQEVTPKTSADDPDSSHVQFYTRQRQSSNKMQALKNAVNGFIDDTAAQNELIANDQNKHRISIVSYASNVQTNAEFTYATGSGVTTLKNAVNGLRADGGTQAGDGMGRAQTVMNGARDNAKKVVIFFTDGQPGDYGFDGNVANSAISTAKDMKDANTTIFSVGVVEGANPNDTSSNLNAYMNAVSSNYPDATSYRNLGQRDPEGDYYKAADDPEGLDKVFEDIFKTVNTGSGSPTYNESGDPTKGGYITFTDQLGDYMKVDEFKSIVFADANFTNPTVGTDAEGNTTYTFQGNAPEDVADIYPEGDLSDVVITVKKAADTDLKTGDTVTVKIPASLIPLRYFNVDKTAGTMSVKDTYPMRVFFGVSLKDGVAEKVASGELASEDAAYVANNTDENGNVSFLSNSWDGTSTGNTTASFVPATTNNYYYFTQDTPIYSDVACTQPVEGHLGNGTYYYKQTFYTMSDDGKAVESSHVASFSGSAAEALQNAVTLVDGKANFKAGTPRITYIKEFQTDKSDNTTKTGVAVLNPNWDNEVVGATNSLTQRLGNNGRLSIEQPGKLAVSKTIDVPEGFNEADYANVDFDFTVTNSAIKDKTVKVEVKGANNAAVEGAITELHFNENGEAQFTLKPGQTITIDGLSASDYTVTETKKEGFTAKVGDQEANTTTAQVKAGATAQAAFTNTLVPTSTTLGTDNVFKGTKTLTDREWMDSDHFAFVLRPVGNAPMPSDAKDNASVAYADAAAGTGATPVDFKFGDIQYDKPGTYTYTIHESEANSADAPGVNFSDAVYRVTVTVSDANKDGKLSASVKMEQLYGDNNEDYSQNPKLVDSAVAAFTNSFSATETTWEPSGQKTYKDNSGIHGNETQFTFRVTASDGAPVPDSMTGREFFVTPAEGGSLTFPVMNFDADSIGEHTYTIQEVIKDENDQWVNVSALANGAATYAKDGMTYDASVQTVTVTVEPAEITHEDGSKEGVINVTPVYSNGTKAFAFSNSYTPAPVTMDDSTSIKGTKTLNGRDMKDDETFGFTLEAADATTRAAMAENGSITNLATTATAQGGANGQAVDFSFGGATFTKPGTFTFNVKETSWNGESLPADNTAGMTFDRTTKQVKVTVSDQGGTLKITSVDYGTDATAAAFTNTYTASTTYGDNGAVKVSKTLNGRALNLNEFGFTIEREGDNGPAVPSVDAEFTNDRQAADGAANTMTKLSGLAFTQDDAGKTYTYVVREKGGQLPGVTYDGNYYKVAIEVIDNGDGSMKTETAVTKFDEDGNDLGAVADGIAAFTNTYKADSVTFDTTANAQLYKSINGRDWKDTDSFSFDIAKESATIDGMSAEDALDAMPKPEKTTATVDQKGGTKSNEQVAFGFGTLTFDKAGTYTYTVTEQKAGEVEDGLTYSKNEATITITVTDNTQTGKLEASERVSGELFENTYAASANFDDAVDFQMTKTLKNRAMEAGQFKFDVTANATGEGDKAVSAEEAAKKIGINNGTTGTVDGAAGAANETVVMPAKPAEGEDDTTPKLTFDLADAGKTFSYTFSEQKGDDTSVTYDKTVYRMDVTPTDNGDGTMSIHTVVTKVKDAEGNDLTGDAAKYFNSADGGKAVSLDFVNVYNASGTLEGATNLAGTKKLVDNEGNEIALANRAWDFTITAGNEATEKAVADGFVKLPEQTKVQNGSDGKFAFGDITFAPSGQTEVRYQFKITESGTVAGVTNDTQTERMVTVKVTDNGAGTLTAEVVADASNLLEFTNAYGTGEGADTSATIAGTKTLDGKSFTELPDIANAYTFKVAADNGAPMNKAEGFVDEPTNPDANGGAVMFGALTFTMADLKDAQADPNTGAREATFTYTVTEEGAVAGVANDADSKTVAVTLKDDGQGKLTAEATDFEFVNNYQPGTLTVSKTVSAGEGGVIDEGKLFDFTVEVTVDGKPLTGSYSDLTFADGKATFQLKHGESKTIKGLPSGATYKVTEAAAAGYTTTSENAEGTISTDAAAEVKFMNTYGSSVPEGRGVALNSQIKKKFEGRTWNESDEFTFQITSANGGPLPDGVKASEDGKIGTVTVKGNGKSGEEAQQLVQFGSIPFTFDDIKDAKPGADGKRTKEFTYTVTELVPEGATGNVKDGITYDTHTATITVVLTDNGDGTLSGETSKVEGDAAQNGVQLMAFVKAVDANVFTNVYKSELDYNANGKGGLTINKTLDGRDMTDGQFQFKVEQTQGDDDRLGIAGMHTSKGADNGVASVVATAKADAKFTNEDAGKTWAYTISEVADDHDGKGYAYDKTTYTVTVSVVDNGDSTLTVTTTVAGGKDGEKTYTYTTGQEPTAAAVVDFNNTYSAGPEYLGGEGDVSLEATKTLTGRPMTEGEFGFTVFNGDDEVATGSNAAAEDGKAGKITFSAIKYTSESLYKDAKAGKATAGTPDADGKITYTYNYTVKETSGTGDGVAATKSEFKVTVKVTDNNDGTLSIAVEPVDGGMAFTNTYGEGEDGKASVSLSGEKNYNKPADSNAPDIAGKFTFTLTGSEGAPMPEKTTTTNDASGNVNFGSIEYTMNNVWPASVNDEQVGTEDEGVAPAKSEVRTKTFTYTVSESGSMPGVTNDATSKTFKVTVTDNGEGKLSVECTDAAGNKVDQGAFKFAFVNTYSTTPVTTDAKTSIGGTKELKVPAWSERTLAAGEFSFTLAPMTDGAPMPKDATVTNDANGNFTFGSMTFDKRGTYTYKLTEVKGTDSSVTYDGSAYNVTVKVEDNGEGALVIESVTYTKNGEPADTAAFVNEYTVDEAGAALTLGATKDLIGRDLKEGEFEFALAYNTAEGKQMVKATNAADGSVTFPEISFKEPGSYAVTVTEKAGSDKTITYDDAEYKATVTVTEKNSEGVFDGKLHASVVYEDGKLPVFKNTYTKPAEPKPTPKPEGPKAPELPQTGDSSVLPMAVAAVAGIACIGGGLALSRRRK